MKCHLLDIDISSISLLPQTLDFCWWNSLTLHVCWFRWCRWQQQSSSCCHPSVHVWYFTLAESWGIPGDHKWLGDIPFCAILVQCHVVCQRRQKKSLCWMNLHCKSVTNLVQERAGCFWSAHSKNSLRKLQSVVACWSSAKVEPLVWWLKDTTSRRSMVFNHGKPI